MVFHASTGAVTERSSNGQYSEVEITTVSGIHAFIFLHYSHINWISMFVRKTQEADRGLEESGVSDYTVFL